MKKLFVLVVMLMTSLLSSPVMAQEEPAVVNNATELIDKTQNVSVEDNVLQGEPNGNPETVGLTDVLSSEDKTIMEKLIGFCLDNLNYGTVALFMAVESSFIPFPSEAVVPPAAWKAATSDDMNVVLVVIFATLGALIGALVNYYIAVWLGRPIIYKFANSRIGHMCLIDEAKVQKAEAYFAKHGVVSTLIGRLVPVVRQLISLPAGLARMGIGRFIIYTSIGAAIWNIILAALGYYMSTIPGMQNEEIVMNKVKEYSGIIGWVFIALAVFVVSYLAYKGLKKDKK